MNTYLAVDLGGTSIKFGVLDRDFSFLKKGAVPARISSREEFFEDIQSIFDTCGRGCEGLAVSMPGAIDRFRGFARSGGAYTWVKDENIAKTLYDRLGVPTAVCNDAKAAALAEMYSGNLRGIRNGVALILGTGVGGGCIVNGALLEGSHLKAGEFSFLRGEILPANNKDIFALYNGVQGLKDAIQEESGLENVDGLEAFRLIKEEKNEAVLRGVRKFCGYLAFFVYTIQVIVDAERFVIGGGISRQPVLLTYIRKNVDFCYQMLGMNMPKAEVTVCQFFNEANLLGAYAHYLDTRK